VRVRSVTIAGLAAAVLLSSSHPALADDKAVIALVASTAGNAMKEIVPLFERSHPGMKIEPTYGGAQVLKAQVDAGAPIDLIVVGSSTMNAIAAKVDTPTVLFSYHEAVLVPKTGAKVHSLKDLGNKGVRLALPTAESPPGAYLHAMLHKASADYGADFEQRVIANATTRKTSAAGIPPTVTSGLVDAAVGFSSDASESILVIAVPPAYDVITKSECAVLKGAPHADAAKAFSEYLRSSEAQQIFRKHHFDI
jgi:molybdate transport system substrate-binding protein